MKVNHRKEEHGQALAETALFAMLAVIMAFGLLAWIPTHRARTAATSAAYACSQFLSQSPDPARARANAVNVAWQTLNADWSATAGVEYRVQISPPSGPGEPGQCLVSFELVDVPVSFPPTHPEFREWRLNANGKASVTYALRGCFETSSVEGNRVEIWGGEYPVVCLVVEDAENTQILYSLNGHMYTSPATPMRSFLLFGYLGDSQWVWLGTQTEPKLEITNAEEIASDRLTVATLYDSQPWDAKWLINTHHLDMQPLPEGWQSMTSEDEKQYILFMLSGSAQ